MADTYGLLMVFLILVGIYAYFFAVKKNYGILSLFLVPIIFLMV